MVDVRGPWTRTASGSSAQRTVLIAGAADQTLAVLEASEPAGGQDQNGRATVGPREIHAHD